MLKLHGFAQSGNTFKVAFLLRALGVPWQPVAMSFADFAGGATRDPAWREGVNEMGAVAAFLKSRIDSAFFVVEKHLARRATIVGSALTIADMSLSGYLFYPADESGYVLEERFPNLAAWRDRLKAAPGWGDPYEVLRGERVAPKW